MIYTVTLEVDLDLTGGNERSRRLQAEEIVFTWIVEGEQDMYAREDDDETDGLNKTAMRVRRVVRRRRW